MSFISNWPSRSSMADPSQPLSLAAMNFDDDLNATSEALDAARWKFERHGALDVWVTLSPAGHAADQYVAQLLWGDYPGDLPPSGKFVDLATGRVDVAEDWPMANGFCPSSFRKCADWTAEGFALHPE